MDSTNNLENKSTDKQDEELIKHIIAIYDNNLNLVPFKKLEIIKIKRKYSLIYSKNLCIDGKPLDNKQQRTYKLKYKCRCGSENMILVCKYLYKKTITCHHCIQKREYTYHIVTNNLGKNKGKKTPKIINPKYTFNDMFDEYKNHYKNIHLSKEEFFKYLPYVYQINDVILTDEIRKNIQYYYAEKVNNQCKFSSKVSFDGGLHKQTIHKFYLVCSICGKKFNIHVNNIRHKNLQKIKCQGCSFTNYRYEIRKYKNLTYQSNLEKYFINKCLEHNIKVENGIKIKYWFENKKHTYITDFYLPEYKYMIEIKSYNIWYKKDLESGKFQAKVNAANEYAKKHNLKYVVLFDKESDSFIENIERDSLSKLKDLQVG